MTQNLEQIGIDAVERFITTWNSRNPAQWAAALNYPHVRPSPLGAIVVATDAEQYASRVDFDKVVATGWDHSEWDYRKIIHTSAQKIHVAGQWSRYNIGGDIIHTNPVVYIVTRTKDQWGIQARFGSDYAGSDHDASGFEERSFKLVQDFIEHFNNKNVDACAELLNYPHYGIGVGELREHLEPAAFGLTNTRLTIESMQSLQTGIKSANIALEIYVQEESQEPQLFQAIMNLTIRDEHLGIQAWSLLNPNANVL